ncbi:sensor histidine kinase [Flavobacterium sp. 7A]|uniref:sensor histidine kinase n=1 Tax=Flavobacterium sp. 7A TaxID=2940571 RepID=UPI00222796EB|nr:ATP-binding protein [Flavobacterium sp. 7A]MCW2120109.1 sigma-B regulation protein RsbU (phosphoserine phosphatase) [Flavobacterium sp. 7A]
MSTITENIFQHSPVYLFVFSEDQYIIQMNSILLEHLGYDAENIIGIKKIGDILTMGSKIFLETHFLPIINVDKKVNEIFLILRTKDNIDLPVLLNMNLVYNESNSYAIHCGGMKISQRNQFEKELIKARSTAELALLENKALIDAGNALEENRKFLERQLQETAILSNQQSEIYKVLSHDLQEPLRKVIFFCNKFTSENNELIGLKNINSIQNIIRLTSSVRSMIDNLQEYQKLNNYNLSYSLIALNPLLKNIVKASYCSNESFTINATISKIPNFKGDKLLITKLFEELINNSIKFRKENQMNIDLNITAVKLNENIFAKTPNSYKFEPYIKILISDNCSGFHCNSNKIFELFERNHNTNTRGIGLSLCKKIVELHNGTITVNSVLGKGSTFTILLPIQETIINYPPFLLT